MVIIPRPTWPVCVDKTPIKDIYLNIYTALQINYLESIDFPVLECILVIRMHTIKVLCELVVKLSISFTVRPTDR